MRLKLLTLAIAVLITLALRLVGYPDLTRIFAAFFNGGTMATGDAAVVVGFVVAVLVWWLIVYLIATRIPRRASR